MLCCGLRLPGAHLSLKERERELVAVPLVCLQFVSFVFSDHTHFFHLEIFLTCHLIIDFKSCTPKWEKQVLISTF